MKAPVPLTAKEKSVLEFIEEFVSQNGIAPSYNEIREHFGLASYNSVQNYLKQLTQKGYLRLAGENQKRAIQLLHSADATVVNLQARKIASKQGPPNDPLPESRIAETLPRWQNETLALPLLGAVAAGRPIESFAHDEYVDVPRAMVRNPDKTFVLKIKGQSMIEDGIFDGDLILVQKQSNANNGEIVVAIVENEATVKRFYTHRNQRFTEKEVELRPANSSMSPMWYRSRDVEVRGVVVGLMRKY